MQYVATLVGSHGTTKTNPPHTLPHPSRLIRVLMIPAVLLYLVYAKCILVFYFSILMVHVGNDIFYATCFLQHMQIISEGYSQVGANMLR